MAAVKVEATVINLKSKLAEDIANQIGDVNLNSTGSNASGSIDEKIAELSAILSVSNGTRALDSGWKSPKSITVDLKGNATLHDAEFVRIAVHK